MYRLSWKVDVQRIPSTMIVTIQNLQYKYTVQHHLVPIL